jgi:hypothetical protein
LFADAAFSPSNLNTIRKPCAVHLEKVLAVKICLFSALLPYTVPQMQVVSILSCSQSSPHSPPDDIKLIFTYILAALHSLQSLHLDCFMCITILWFLFPWCPSDGDSCVGKGCG